MHVLRYPENEFRIIVAPNNSLQLFANDAFVMSYTMGRRWTHYITNIVIRLKHLASQCWWRHSFDDIQPIEMRPNYFLKY